MALISGSCLCGAVTFSCENQFAQFYLCHCRQCQKASGSAHVANLFTDPANICWLTGADNVQRFDVPGRVISSAFCRSCGSPVPYPSLSGVSLVVPAGSLDGEPNLLPQGHIFWQEHSQWYESVAELPHIDRFPD